MTKAAEPKPAAIAAKNRSPFFNKGEDSALQLQNDIPFFSAPQTVQAKCAACEAEEEAVQTKPIFESEAGNPLQRKCTECAGEEELQKKEEKPEEESPLQMKCAACAEEEEKAVQPKTEGAVTNATEKEEETPQLKKLQTKLTVGQPGDVYEQEADAVADKVVQKMSEPAPAVQTQTSAPATGEEELQKKEEEEKPEEESPAIQKITDLGGGAQRMAEEPEKETETPVQTKPIFESERETPVQRRCRECEEGDKLFLKPVSQLQLSPAGSSGGNGSREAVIAAARTMLGKIEAKHNDGGGKRVGAKYLLEIFHKAAPGVWPDSIIETAGAQLPSWCGIFSVWAHKQAGKDIGNWQMGRGVSAFGKLKQTTTPQPGDIGYIDQPYQHHCIVVKLDGSNVHTIDGNSGLFSEVKENIRPLSEYSGFFTAFGAGSSVQRKEENSAPASAPAPIENQLASSKGGGSPLPDPVRNNMESAMGADFSNVKVHTGSSAEQMSQDLNAQAFTHGSDIYFNSGKFDTQSSEGQHLLAHELTHTVQQGAAVQRKAEEEKPEPEENTIQKQEAPAIQKDDGDDPIQESVSKVYDALDGWTDSEDSEIIRYQFDSTDKATTDSIMNGVATKAEYTVDEVMDWMYSDMVTSDWNALFGHLVTVEANRVDHLIASQVYSYLSGYTSDSNSNSILNIFTGSTPVTGELLGRSLTELEAVTEKDSNGAVEYLFGDMTDLDAHKLSLHFFGSNNTKAVNAAAYWIAYKVANLISGFTGMDDSEAIVKNFSRVPADLRSIVLYKLETISQERWSQTAAEALMEDMWQSDYEELRTLMPGQLPIYNIERAWYDWAWEVLMDGYDFLSALVQYAVCGLLGVIWGVVTVVIDIIVAIVDIVLAVKDLLGAFVYFITGGKFCKENYDRVQGFFKAIGLMWDAPGDAIAAMWDELVLEGELIEGPFAACERAIFWTSRFVNLFVNILLIFAAGYGVLKGVMKGIEAIVTLARAGELISALEKIPAALWSAIKKLPSSVAKAIIEGTTGVLKLLQSPLEIIGKVRQVIMTIRLAAEDEKFFHFLRKQAGKAIEGEAAFWRERRAFWQKSAAEIEGGANATEGKLVGAAESAVDDPAKAKTVITEAEADANAGKAKADSVMDEIDGTKPVEKPKEPVKPVEPPKDPVPPKEPEPPKTPEKPKEPEKPKDPDKPPPTQPPSLNDRLPEAWREGSPTRPPRLKNVIDKLKDMGYSDDSIAKLVNNIYAKASGDGANIFADLNNIVLKNPESPLVGGRANADKLVEAMSGDANFNTARFLISRPQVNQSIAELMRVFTLEDIGALRAQFASLSDAQFVSDMNGILPRITGSREEILALIKESGEPALENLNTALDRLGQGSYTPEEVRKSLAYGENLAKAMAEGGDALAKEIWEDPKLEKTPEGKYKVSASQTGDKAGDQASAFIRARADRIVAQTGVLDGTTVNAQKWDMLVQSIRNTDLPVIVQNDIIGELWSSTKVLQYRRLGYDVIREVTIEILTEAGKPTGKKTRLDAVVRKGQEILYKEFKSSATASKTTNQKLGYKLLEEGKAGQLRPTGPNAETAFGGPKMPEFKAKAVDIERPPGLPAPAE